MKRLLNAILSKPAILLLSLSCFILSALPLFSVYLPDGEACTLYFSCRSLLGGNVFAITLTLAPLLVPTILYGCQKMAAREAELILLLLGNCVCYANAVINAQAWFYEISDSLIKYTVVMGLYPLIFITLCILAIISNFYQKGEQTNDN